MISERISPNTHSSNRCAQQFTTEFQEHVGLLCLILKGEEEAAIERLRRGEVRANKFAQFITRHRLQICLYSLVQNSSVRQCLPQEWLDEVEGFSSQQVRAQATLLEELLQLSSLLATADYDCIVLKGPYLATRFFGAINRRAFYDLDLLIRREKLQNIESLLRKNGYIRQSTILLNHAITTRFTHAFDFAKAGIIVDLHWSLSANAAHDLDYETIWSQRQSFLLRNQRIFVLSDEHEVVFNLISLFKDLERGARCLKAFIDLYFILKTVSRNIDWDRFFEDRRRERILRISVNILVLFLTLLDCRDQFPELGAALARHRQLLKRGLLQSPYRLIEASPGALVNKRWGAGMYDCSRLYVFMWWLISLPFRLAVYHPGKYARFKLMVQNWKKAFWVSWL